MAYPVFDLHCDTADRLAWPGLDQRFHQLAGSESFSPEDVPGDTRLADNGCHLSIAKMGGVPWAQCFACFIYDEFPPEESLAFYRQVMDHLEREVADNADAIALAAGPAGIRDALGRGGRVAVKTIENARMFAADPSLVDALAGEGVLMASLSWNAEGPLGSGCDAPAVGLTRTGVEVVRRMEDAGMVLDVSHLNDACFSDVARIAERPFVASHSNSRAVCGHPRNLTDAQFAEIRDRGGLVGLNYCPDFLSESFETAEPTEDDLCRHVEHWLDMGGEDVVALGSDFDGTDLPSCISSAERMPRLQEAFERRFGERIARKLCAENALAFFERCAG